MRRAPVAAEKNISIAVENDCVSVQPLLSRCKKSILVKAFRGVSCLLFCNNLLSQSILSGRI